MDDLISRQAAIDALAEHEKSRGHNYTLFVDIVSECAEIIRNLPSVQPERKKGKWNWDFADNGWADWTCSICGWKKNTDIHVNLGYNYCPNCGARMEGEEDEHID